jgi:hypothetical protein
MLTLGSIPVELHDRNSEGKCCNAEAEWVELDAHDGKLVGFEQKFLVFGLCF